MHGITKEVWRLARASRAFHTGEAPGNGSQGVYHELLRRIAEHAEIDLRILVDIMAGASAGGINAIFLAHAIAGGRPLDPLTDLWLDSAERRPADRPGGQRRLALSPRMWRCPSPG
jgi:hypothetical protein